MTEDKRFTIETEGISDKEAVWDGDRLISFVEDKECIEKLVDLLNGFYDWNKELKKENEELKCLLNVCKEGQQNLIKDGKKCNDALNKIWDILNKEIKGETYD